MKRNTIASENEAPGSPVMDEFHLSSTLSKKLKKFFPNKIRGIKDIKKIAKLIIKSREFPIENADPETFAEVIGKLLPITGTPGKNQPFFSFEEFTKSLEDYLLKTSDNTSQSMTEDCKAMPEQDFKKNAKEGSDMLGLLNTSDEFLQGILENLPDEIKHDPELERIVNLLARSENLDDDFSAADFVGEAEKLGLLGKLNGLLAMFSGNPEVVEFTKDNIFSDLFDTPGEEQPGDQDGTGDQAPVPKVGPRPPPDGGKAGVAKKQPGKKNAVAKITNKAIQ